MDATQEQSFYIIGSRAGMTEEQISNCLQVNFTLLSILDYTSFKRESPKNYLSKAIDEKMRFLITGNAKGRC